jgi:hypothetical protein
MPWLDGRLLRLWSLQLRVGKQMIPRSYTSCTYSGRNIFSRHHAGRFFLLVPVIEDQIFRSSLCVGVKFDDSVAFDYLDMRCNHVRNPCPSLYCTVITLVSCLRQKNAP